MWCFFSGGKNELCVISENTEGCMMYGLLIIFLLLFNWRFGQFNYFVYHFKG